MNTFESALAESAGTVTKTLFGWLTGNRPEVRPKVEPRKPQLAWQDEPPTEATPEPVQELTQHFVTYPVLPAHALEALLDVDATPNYFQGMIGQTKAKRRLARAARQALERPDHQCSRNFLLDGPSSSGKTSLVRLFINDVLGIPMLELDANNLRVSKNPKAEILYEISQCLLKWDQQWRDAGHVFEDEFGLTLIELPGKRFRPPPMGILIDEAHKLPHAVQDALLKATERQDRMMATENGYTLDCSRICWFLATTRRGELREEFDNRFKKVRLTLYTKGEIAQIIELNHPDWHPDLCRVVAYYAPRVPREAKDLAEEIEDEMNAHPDIEPQRAVENVVADAEIDRFGMTLQRVAILTALGQQGPMSAKRLAGVAECDEETLRERLLPPLLASLQDEPALVGITHRHFITPAGLKELDKRGIRHLGKKALPKDFVTMAETIEETK